MDNIVTLLRETDAAFPPIDFNLQDETKTLDKASKQRNIQKHKSIGTVEPGPIGFLKVRDKGGRVTLIPDPKTYQFIEEAIRYRKQGRSFKWIAKTLAKKGFRSRTGKVVLPMTLARILERLKIFKTN